MNPEPTVSPELENTVAALVDVGGTLSQIVGHMAAFSAERVALPGGQEGMRAPDTLRQVLADVLAQEADLPDPATLARCATLLREIDRVIGEEIFLVPLDLARPPRPQPARRRRRR